ncbi:MAG: VIT domain-containing protein, partial [Sphingopyxis sp.]
MNGKTNRGPWRAGGIDFLVGKGPMMRRFYFALGAVTLGLAAEMAVPGAVAAQNRRAANPAPQAPANAPATQAPTLALSGHVRGVRSDAMASQDLAIEVLDLKVRIRGGVAETTMTATFRNTGQQQLEGDFLFDMPAGSVITGYALDVGANMIDGVLAGRDQAREAYQRRVVQRVDPGLAEVSWSDRFSTRIFPIPAAGSRTIRLVMASPLDPVAGYILPMRPSGRVGRLTMVVDSDAATPPTTQLPSGVHGGWAGGRLSVDQWNVPMAGQLRLNPAARANGMMVSRHASGDAFFDIEDALPAQGSNRANGGADGAAAPVHVLWDRSVSRADDDREGEIALLRAWMLASGARPSALTLFDSGGAETVAVQSIDDLVRRLRAVRYNGGTSFSVLSDVQVAAGAQCVLISDGRATVDGRAGFALPCRTNSIASGREVDRGWLADVAARSGGAMVELGSSTTAQAVAALSAGGATIGQVVDATGRVIDAVRLAAGPGRFRLIGPMPDHGSVSLRMADGRVWRVFSAADATASAFSGAGALWAARRISAQSNDARTADLVAMARRYSVASPLASFIVLENPADYVEANIPPPTSYPKALADEFTRLRAVANTQLAAAQARRLQDVTALWDQQRAWWNTPFNPDAKSPQDGQRIVPVAGQGGNVMEPVTVLVPPSPPPPPAPPPPAPPPPPVSPSITSGGDDGAGEIIITARRVEQRAMDVPVAIAAVSAESLDAAADATDAATDGNDATDLAAGAPTPRAGPQGRAGAINIVEWSSEREWIAALDRAGAQWSDELERQRAAHGNF